MTAPVPEAPPGPGASQGSPVPLVVANGLAVRLGGRSVLDGVDLELHAGGWTAVVGPNGAGKTTLLRAVAGLAQCAAGTVLVGGVPVADLPARTRAQTIAVVPQTPAVPPGMTVAEYVLLGRTPHIAPLRTERHADLVAVDEALRRLDLGLVAGRVLATLSGGERQRAFLARALAQGAPVLLLDEPTTALDVGHQQQVLELVDHLRRERRLAVLSTMHDLTLAGQYADRLVLLDGGRVAAEGAVDAVLTEATLARHFGARVRVLGEGANRAVVPLRLNGSDGGGSVR